MGGYFRPADLAEAVTLLAAEAALPLAGGTDLYPADAAGSAWGEPSLEARSDRAILDLSRLEALQSIRWLPDRVEIGALVTWAALRDHPWPPGFEGLCAAAREVGGVQIQNRATIGGNLCNASPAADGVPPLLALEARVRLQSRRGVRELPLGEFILGNRRTARQADELLTHILVPRPAETVRSVFLKLGARRYLVISIVAVAVSKALDAQGRLADVRIAVGACAPAARRLRPLERKLVGRRPEAVRITPEDCPELAPIDDVRASAAYRREAACVLIERALCA